MIQLYSKHRNFTHKYKASPTQSKLNFGELNAYDEKEKDNTCS